MLSDNINAEMLANIVSSKHRITKLEARQVVDLIFTSIATGMQNGIQTRIPKFGVFCVQHKPARMVMNPRKGVMVQGVAKVSPRVRWSSVLFREPETKRKK
jgi:DNA-binding protein HU-beta